MLSSEPLSRRTSIANFDRQQQLLMVQSNRHQPNPQLSLSMSFTTIIHDAMPSILKAHPTLGAAAAQLRAAPSNACA